MKKLLLTVFFLLVFSSANSQIKYHSTWALGILIDGSQSNLGKGGAAIEGSWKKIFTENKVIDFGIKSSFGYFINSAQSENFVSTSIPHNDFTLLKENNFDISISEISTINLNPFSRLHLGLGLLFLDKLNIAKSNVTDLLWNQGNELDTSPFVSAGFEFSPAKNRLLMEFEYSRTRTANYFSINLGFEP